MVRKKSDRKCFNPDNYNMFFIKDYCLCTEDDFHCDFGYIRDKGGYCVVDREINDMKEPENCNGFYYKTDGY